jgi:hypothetical protein
MTARVSDFNGKTIAAVLLTSDTVTIAFTDGTSFKVVADSEYGAGLLYVEKDAHEPV